MEAVLKGDFSGFGPAICGVEFCGEDWTDYGARYGLWNDKLGLPKTGEGFEEAVKLAVKSSS